MITSYRDLAKLGKLLGNQDVFIKTVVGLYALEKHILAVNEFVTNRYFQEALGINMLPTTEQLSVFLNERLSKELKSLTEALIKEIKLSRPAQFQLDHQEMLDRQGYVVIPNVLTKEEVESLRSCMVWQAQREIESGEAYVYGANSQRVYNLLNKGINFRNTIKHPLIIEIMDHMFDRPTLHDKYYLSSWHANLVGPGAGSGMLHLDAAVPEPIPPWIVRANVMFMLDDFTEENGATVCIPFSHKWCKKPGHFPHPSEHKVMTGTAGSMAVWHGHLWHQSGANRTDKDRIALLGCFANSALREMALEENHFRVVDKDILENMDDDLKVLLGYDHGIKKGAMWK